MDIYDDFDFIPNKIKDDLRLGDGIFKKNDLQDALHAINSVNEWAKNCLYKKYFNDIYILLTDCPGDGVFAQIDEEPENKKVFIEMNILAMIDSYYHSDFKKIIFKYDISLFDFFAFFLLHELGHIVHCHFIINKGNIYQKMVDYSVKYLSYHESIDKKYGYYYDEETDKKVQRTYRRIPSEKFSDSFAFRHLNEIK